MYLHIPVLALITKLTQFFLIQVAFSQIEPATACFAEKSSKLLAKILATTGERALVRGTLRPGDRLAVEGVHRIVPGQRVRPEDLPNTGIER